MKIEKRFVFITVLTLLIGGFFLNLPALADEEVVLTGTNSEPTVLCHGRTFINGTSTNGVKVTIWLTYNRRYENQVRECTLRREVYSYQNGTTRGYYQAEITAIDYAGGLEALFLLGEKDGYEGVRSFQKPRVYLDNYRHIYLD